MYFYTLSVWLRRAASVFLSVDSPQWHSSSVQTPCPVSGQPRPALQRSAPGTMVRWTNHTELTTSITYIPHY